MDLDQPDETGKAFSTFQIPNFPFGCGEMSELIGQHDWSQTPIGAIKFWPVELCFATNLILASKFPMAILWGEELIFIYNEGYKLLINHKHPSAIGKSTKEIWPEVWSFNQPIFEKVLKHGETIHLEDQLFRINRHWVSEETFFTLCYSPIRLINNSIGGVLVVLQETTRYMLSERRIREGEQILRNIIDSTPSHIFATDSENRFTIVNKSLADFCESSMELMSGKSIDEFFPIEVANKLKQTNNDIMANGMTKLFEEEVRSKSSKNLIHVMTSKFPIRNDSGKIIGSGGVATDITERKRLEKELIDAKNKAEETASFKSKFLDIAAHELRTPVTIILLLVDLLKRNFDRTQNVDEAKLRQLRDSASSLKNLINDLLDVSRLERGSITLQKEKLNLSHLINKCVEDFRLLDPQRVFFISALGPDVDIWVDRTRIIQVLSNLLENANKYTPKNTSIEVRLETTSSKVRVSVLDHGPGIPQESMENLFHPFSRGNSSYTTNTSGLGLGLSVCKGIMDLHGGGIGVLSEQGKGSTFYFELPFDQNNFLS